MVQILKIKKKAGNKPMAENKTDREVKTENEAKTEETAKTEKIKKKKGGLVSGIIFGLIFLIGLSILFYPTISNQWNTYRQQKLITNYSTAVEEMTPEDFDKVWQKARDFNATMTNNVYSDAFDVDEEDLVNTEYWKILNVGGDGVMGYISIPKINIRLAIYHGTGDTVLQTGVGHLNGSGLPIGETGSHCILAAHRGLPSARLFTDIDQLEIGDMFYLHVLDETMAYKVDQILPMVDKDDRETLEKALQIEEDQDLVTLFTCTPYGVNSHRLLVRGHRVPYTEDMEAETAVDSMVRAIQNYYMLYLILGLAVTILIILILKYLFRPRRRADEKDSREDEK
jgi:sortase A